MADLLKNFWQLFVLDLIYYKIIGKKAGLAYAFLEKEYRSISFSLATLFRLLKKITESKIQLLHNVNPRLVFWEIILFLEEK